MTAVIADEADTRAAASVRRRRTRSQTLADQVRAFEMLDRGSSFDQIAGELGYANRSGAWKLVNRGLTASRNQAAAVHFELAEARWTALMAAWWQPALCGDTKAAAVVSRALAALDALWGLAAPGRRAGDAAAREPRGIVMTDEEVARWEAAGSPARWNG